MSSNRFFMGVTNDITAEPPQWDSKVLASCGIGDDNRWKTYTLGIQCEADSGTYYFYINRRLIGAVYMPEIPSDVTYLWLPDSEDDPGLLGLGCTRWLKQGTEISPELMMKENGFDTYYP